MQIRAALPLPRGARLVTLSASPARIQLRWRPQLRQLGEYRLAFRAIDDLGATDRLRLRVHVGRRATRSFRLSGTGLASVVPHAKAAAGRIRHLALADAESDGTASPDA